MENDSSIFSEADPFLRRKYTLRVTTARVFLFIYICLAAILLTFVTLVVRAYGTNGLSVAGVEAACLLLLIVLAILSLRNYFLPLLIATVLISIGFLIGMWNLINGIIIFGLNVTLLRSGVVLFVPQIVVVTFLIRGIIFANRLKALDDDLSHF